MEDLGVLLWLLVPAVVLVHAAVCDLRRREVPDSDWFAMSLLCIPPSSAVVSGGDPLSMLAVAGGSAILMMYALSAWMSGWRAASFGVLSAALFAIAYIRGGSPGSLVIPAMFLALLGLHRVGVLRGGADAKCMMALAVSFPVYPESSFTCLLWEPAYPQAWFANPSAAVLVTASMLCLASPVLVAFLNMSEGRRGWRMFSSYRMSVEDARSAFVWPAERMEGGEKVRCPPADDRDAVYDGLEAAGHSTVEVVPMIPFILPVAMASLVVFALGFPSASVIGARC